MAREGMAGGGLVVHARFRGRHGQGGRPGFKNERFRYHNSFLIADARHAWLLETAGRFWAACWIRNGIRTTSNVLTIGVDYTKVGPGTIEGGETALTGTNRGRIFVNNVVMTDALEVGVNVAGETKLMLNGFTIQNSAGCAYIGETILVRG